MPNETHYALPDAVSPFAGKLNDIDSHENIPINHWREHFGSVCDDLISAIRQTHLILNADKERDDAEINSENVWRLKWEQAPGAFDFDRRLKVMDFIGIKRQLMYPGQVGINALSLYSKADDRTILRGITGDRRAYAKKIVQAYNEWCVRISDMTDRLRPVVMLVEETPEDFYQTAKRFVDRGARAFWIPTDRPPANLSPAHPAFDPLWDVLAKNNCPLLSHVGSEDGFMKTMVWRDAPAFEGWRVGGEFRLDPWTLTSLHLPTQNFLTTMVLGGVFERHPNFHFATAEVTGHWVGPWAEHMDRFYAYTPFPQEIGVKALKLRPSDYVRRNIRVAPFDFEPVGDYIAKFGMEEVYSFASDFPHKEGGTDPINRFKNSLSKLDPSVIKKFFVTNGSTILPD